MTIWTRPMRPHPFPAEARPQVRRLLLLILLISLFMPPLAARADLIGHGGFVRSIAISPDGDRVLTASFDYTVRLWDFGEQREIGVLDEHYGPVNAVRFSRDNTRAITASDDRTAILWDLKALKPIRKFSGHLHKVMAVAFSEDGKHLATGSWDRTVRIWDIKTGKTIQTLKTLTAVDSVAFAANDILVSGGHDAALQIWNLKSGQLIKTLQGHNFAITKIDISADGWQVLSTSIDNKMKLWDLKTYEQVRDYAHHDGQVLDVRYGPGGATAATVGRDGQLIQWDVASGKVIRAIPAHKAMAWAVSLTPDGRFALTSGADESIRVWHLETGDRIGPRAELAYADTPKPWLKSNHPGAKVYRKCAICHALSDDEPQRSGPHFKDLFTRRAGSLGDYRYSDTLKSASFKWDENTLFQLFDLGPDVFLPGTKMPVQKIKDPSHLHQLIDYMKELTRAQ